MLLKARLQRNRVNAPLNVRLVRSRGATYLRIGSGHQRIGGESWCLCGAIGVSDPIRWLYALRLTIDANFRLKNKAHGIKNDSPLGDGWGHWVLAEPYDSHIEKFGHVSEVGVIH
jgi:hypothetical protein